MIVENAEVTIDTIMLGLVPKIVDENPKKLTSSPTINGGDS